jgi:uncharacterized membrane protein
VIPLILDTVGSLALAAFALEAAWRLVAGVRLPQILLRVAMGIRLGLTFKIAATMLALSAHPSFDALARMALVIALRLLIRSRTGEAAERLASAADLRINR